MHLIKTHSGPWLRFEGDLLGVHETEPNSRQRYTRYELYQAESGEFVAVKGAMSDRDGELDMITYAVCDDIAGCLTFWESTYTLIDWLAGMGFSHITTLGDSHV
ncbi:MAG: hypothetical protein AAGA36_00130 [Pseudomonadota bacterium]